LNSLLDELFESQDTYHCSQPDREGYDTQNQVAGDGVLEFFPSKMDGKTAANRDEDQFYRGVAASPPASGWATATYPCG